MKIEFWTFFGCIRVFNHFSDSVMDSKIECLPFSVKMHIYFIFFPLRLRMSLVEGKSFPELHREASTTAACTVFVLWVNTGVWINIVIRNIIAYFDCFNKKHQHEAFLSGDTNDH